MTQHKLIIAEKPSVARELSKIVGANKKQDGYYEGGGYLVSWCRGHLISLSYPEAYGKQYQSWNVDDLPIFPDQWIHEIKKDTAAQYKLLKKLMHRTDVSSLICATDSGREGEHIFRLVYHHAGCTKPFERLWISSMEETAIREGMQNLKNGSEYDPLANAADCRDKADWLVGMNASRLFHTGVGRVQSPTLAMVVHREEQIAAFKPSYSYAVRIACDGFSATGDKMERKEDAEALCKFVNGQTATITKIGQTDQKKSPPKLYDLTTLQREANRMFGLSAKETLDLAQNLYEKKLLTYPRTDSSYITEDMTDGVNNLLSSLAGHECFSFAVLGESPPDLKRIANTARVSDHHALLPTQGVATVNLSALPTKELTVLSMVVCRLFAAVSQPEHSIKVDVKLLCGDTAFWAKGKVVVSKGWKGVQEGFRSSMAAKAKDDKKESGDQAATLPPLSEGQVFTDISAQVDTIKTSPPGHFTEDTLLAAMERAGNNEYDDPEVEKKGLGTPATMAETIEKLIARKLLARDKKYLLPTQSGCNLVKLLPHSLTSPKLTVAWETALQNLARGVGSADNFMEEVRAYLYILIAEFDVMTPEQKALIPGAAGRESVGSCPRCRNPVYAGKNHYYCSQNEACGFFILGTPYFFQKYKKKLSQAMVKDFLSQGSAVITGLRSDRSDRTFDATVYMIDTGEKWVNFTTRDPSKPKESKK